MFKGCQIVLHECGIRTNVDSTGVFGPFHSTEPYPQSFYCSVIICSGLPNVEIRLLKRGQKRISHFPHHFRREHLCQTYYCLKFVQKILSTTSHLSGNAFSVCANFAVPPVPLCTFDLISHIHREEFVDTLWHPSSDGQDEGSL